MSRIKFSILVIFIFNIILNAQSARLLTYNIRYANNNPGEEWDLRKENVASIISNQNPDIFGVQEAVFKQIQFLKLKFVHYTQIGVGRDDGIEQGEFSALFISDRYNIIKSGTFWLSETPDTSSFGWDASYKRVATWSIIVNKKSKDSLFVMNTHLDNEGIVARNESVKLLLIKIEELSRNLPIILLGDFNFTSEFEGYKTLVNTGLLKDSQFETTNNYGTNITFNGFDNNIMSGNKIDYVFVSDKIKVINHLIIDEQMDSKYPSDHMPVAIDFELKK